jgi:hypothetical protein
MFHLSSPYFVESTLKMEIQNFHPKLRINYVSNCNSYNEYAASYLFIITSLIYSLEIKIKDGSNLSTVLV